MNKREAQMGNPLSRILLNLFMSRFEIEKSKDLQYFLRIWLRYLDYIFPIFDICKPNRGHTDIPKIKFTFK